MKRSPNMTISDESTYVIRQLTSQPMLPGALNQ